MSFIFWNLLNETATSTKEPPWLNNIEISSIFLLIQIPIACIFGMITNGLNILVFLNTKMKDISFKYMLAISLSNFIYDFILVYAYFIYCDNCYLFYSYNTQVYKIIVNNYLANSLAIFSSFVEIYLSIQRYYILKNIKSIFQTESYKLVLFFILIISLVYYIPALFCYDIKAKQTYYYINNNNNNFSTINYQIEYSTLLNSFGTSFVGKFVTITLVLIRILLCSVILTLINITNALEFRRRFYCRAVYKLKRAKSGKLKIKNFDSNLYRVIVFQNFHTFRVF